MATAFDDMEWWLSGWRYRALALQEVDAAEGRGMAPGLADNLRATVEQSARDHDIASLRAIADYASRYASRAYEVQTPEDRAAQAGLDAAHAVAKGAGTLELVLAGVLLLLVVR